MPDAASPRRFGRYVVLSTLGAGAMGEVLRARDERLGREVAIKTVRNLFGVHADLFRARFEAEAKALAALSHPAIVGVHDLGVEPGPGGEEPFLVMELVDGPSLKRRLEDGPLAAAEVRALGIQLARALEAAHARGILHRDVKPANVLLAPNGQWKLADFGVAHVPDSSMTMTGQFLGTPAYAAPEALCLGQFGEASDVFGLAATLVEAATGVRLRGDATLSELVRRSDESIALPPGLPEPLARVLAPALATDPARRPSAARLAEQLATADAGASTAAAGPATAPGVPAIAALDVVSLGTAATAMLPPTRAGTAPPRRRVAWIAGAIAGGALVIGLVAAASRGGSGTAGAPAAFERGAPGERDGDRADDRGDRRDRGGPPPWAGAGRGGEPVRIAMPAGLDGKGAKEWRKVAEKVAEGKYGEAREKLEEFEDRFGRSPESAQLRAILDELPDDRDRDDD